MTTSTASSSYSPFQQGGGDSFNNNNGSSSSNNNNNKNDNNQITTRNEEGSEFENNNNNTTTTTTTATIPMIRPSLIPANTTTPSIQPNTVTSTSTTSTTTTTTNNNIVRVGVGVIVLNNKKQIYVGRRKNSHGHNTIALPGGHLEYNETWEQCAQREVMEEMNIQLDINKIQFVHVSNNIMPIEKKHYITIIMISKQLIVTEPINMEPNKCDGWVPYDINELYQLAKTNPEQIFLPLLQLLQQNDSISLLQKLVQF